jgi:hypothetical protein
VRGADVDRQHPVEVGVGQVRGGADGVDAGVVDQDVDPAAQQRGRVAGEGAQVRVRPGEVGLEEVGTATGGGDPVCDVLAAGGVAAADEDVGALECQGQRVAAPMPLVDPVTSAVRPARRGSERGLMSEVMPQF